MSQNKKSEPLRLAKRRAGNTDFSVLPVFRVGSAMRSTMMRAPLSNFVFAEEIRKTSAETNQPFVSHAPRGKRANVPGWSSRLPRFWVGTEEPYVEARIFTSFLLRRMWAQLCSLGYFAIGRLITPPRGAWRTLGGQMSSALIAVNPLLHF